MRDVQVVGMTEKCRGQEEMETDGAPWQPQIRTA